MTASCGRTRRVLWPDAGPRAASDEVVEAQRHLAGCAACQQFMRDMRDMADLAASAAPPPAASADLRDRLFGAVARARSASPAPRRRRPAAALLAVAALLLAMVATGLAIRERITRPDLSDVITVLAEDHARALGETRIVSSDAAEITRWLSEQVHFAAFVPVLPGAELRGARLCVMDGRRGAVVVYEVDGERLSYFIVPTGGDRDRDADVLRFAHASRSGYHVVSWRDPGLVHAMIGRAPPSRLEQLARHCVEQMRRMVAWLDVGTMARTAATPPPR